MVRLGLKGSSLAAGSDPRYEPVSMTRWRAARARVESYRAGQEIFAKGSPGDTMIVVLQGSVKIVSLSPTGKEVVVHAGAILGELAVITGEGRSAGAAAMTDCELLIIDRRDVLPMFERHFEICIMLIQILCRRLWET